MSRNQSALIARLIKERDMYHDALIRMHEQGEAVRCPNCRSTFVIAKRRCNVCDKLIAATDDCGGTCRHCMAEAGDPDCKL